MGGEHSTRYGVVRRALERGHRVALRCAFQLLRLYWFVFRPRTHGAFVAVWARGRLLCIRNSYRRELGLPGGRVRRGEEEREAAARELREEVGVVVDPGTLQWVGRLEFRYEYKRDRCDLFEWRLDEEPSFAPDRREGIWAGFRSPDDLLGEPASPVLEACLRRALSGTRNAS